MRGKRITLNAIAGLAHQLAMVIYSFIFPRMEIQKSPRGA